MIVFVSAILLRVGKKVDITQCLYSVDIWAIDSNDCFH